MPAGWLNRRYRKQQRANDLATVIFSSGSTGMPKGVMLSHHNILANVESIGQVIQFTPKDRIMGVLPLFHSFGFTGTLWLPLLTGFGAVYHPNPTDAKTIGETIQKYQATLFISTSTFYAGYSRTLHEEQFASLRYVIAGAEKLREPIAKAYQEKYGITILEGYGCTELSPVVSVNTPDVIDGKEKQTRPQAGHRRPADARRRREDHRPEHGAAALAGARRAAAHQGAEHDDGLPQPTRGDRRRHSATAGTSPAISPPSTKTDLSASPIDSSRFSKIGGEMVPHMKIEEVINEILGNSASVVTAVPDEQRGEKLVAFYSQNGMTKEELWNRLNQSGLPKLWIPKRENLHAIDSLPLLGSGKVDLKKIKTLALEQSKLPV